MYIGKLFETYDVEFPIEKDLAIVIGNCGSGKTHVLKKLAQYFATKGENVLYFPDFRKFTVNPNTAEGAINGLFLMDKLNNEDPYEKYGFNKDYVDYEMRNLDKYYNRYIDGGFIQWVNIMSNLLVNADKDIIVIIDTPETSLHINVQQKLIKNILKFPNIKKLFLCTHAPSIIDDYYDSIIDIEKCVNLNG